MKILLTGASGQLGLELQHKLAPLGRLEAADRSRLDYCAPAALAGAIESLVPEVIVNAAAYTAVDLAEAEEAVAHRVNAEAVAVLGERARACGALVVHFSSDYVFDGEASSPYDESAPAHPLNAYGRTKLAGELALRDSGCDHLVLRTSWVYGLNGRNFLLTMLRLARAGEPLRVVDDQVGTPNWSRTIAAACASLVPMAMRERRVGRFESALLHLSAAGETSWHGFAQAILSEASRASPHVAWLRREVTAITSSEAARPAQRPAKAVLACASIARRYGVILPPWRDELRRCLAQWPELESLG